MELIGYIILASIVGFIGWVSYLGIKSKEFKDTVEDIKEELDEIEEEIEEIIESIPTPDELKKMTKAKLAELAAKHGIMVDVKSTKKVIIEEIESNR